MKTAADFNSLKYVTFVLGALSREPVQFNNMADVV